MDKSQIKKIKILYVVTKSNWGGAQRYVFDLATRLPKDKFDIAVAAGGEGLLMDKLRSAGIRTVSIPHLERDINAVKEMLSLFFLFRLFKEELPDIVHLNSTKIGGLGAVAARWAAWSTAHPIKIIFTAHGWGFNEDRIYIARLIIFLAQWITLLFCDITICVSCAVLHQGMYFPLVFRKLRLIPLSVERPEFLPKTSARRELAAIYKTLPLNPGFLWIGAIAELTKNKGLVYLVEAAKQLSEKNKNFQILIFGEGEERKMLEEKILRHGLEGIILLLGFAEGASKYLKAFDIFTLPSITEAGAYVLHEAGFAGLPVVATKVGGIPYLIEDGKNGFLAPKKDPGALATALEKLISNEELRSQFGKTNQKIISERFSFDKMLSGTIDIYNRL